MNRILMVLSINFEAQKLQSIFITTANHFYFCVTQKKVNQVWKNMKVDRNNDRIFLFGLNCLFKVLLAEIKPKREY